jgi:hypothetical protein
MKIKSRTKDVDQARLLSTDDAVIWAEEFAKRHPEIDQGELIGWFASCAENAKDQQRRREEKKIQERQSKTEWLWSTPDMTFFDWKIVDEV